MKLSIATITFAALVQSSVAFAPALSTRTFSVASSSTTAVFSEPADDEEEGLDLNLEEMFDM